MNAPVIYVRLTSESEPSERARVVHLVQVAAADVAPETLKALCGRAFHRGEAERLADLDGMPCFPCLMASSQP